MRQPFSTCLFSLNTGSEAAVLKHVVRRACSWGWGGSKPAFPWRSGSLTWLVSIGSQEGQALPRQAPLCGEGLLLWNGSRCPWPRPRPSWAVTLPGAPPPPATFLFSRPFPCPRAQGQPLTDVLTLPSQPKFSSHPACRVRSSCFALLLPDHSLTSFPKPRPSFLKI